MGLTLSEKIIARAAGKKSVRPGEIVTCRVDLAMMHDSSGPRLAGKKLDELGVPIWDVDKLVVVTDHYVNLPDETYVRMQTHAAEWCKSHGVKHFIQDQGICHIVLPEYGHVKPGLFCVGADSHSTTAGALGAFMVGVGASEMTGVLATGEIWVRVPETALIEVTGKLSPGVAAKYVVLKICGEHGIMGFDYQVVEFAGSAVAAMPVEDRLTLTNMAAELGAKTGIIAPDAKTADKLAQWGVGEIDAGTWASDQDATFAKRIVVEGALLGPQVAAPSSPENAADVAEHAGTKLDQAYLGACTGAKVEDLRMAARVVNGRRAPKGFRFLVAPSTRRMRDEAAAEGILRTLEDAGAVVLPSGCGGCIGMGPARLPENAVGISSTNRNFVGRAGPKSSKLYLASPYTVAASAMTGRITDPREFL
ncbi:MAG TPA: aconitase/3-isopropylmalate dehydratase large subunit family protein [Rhodospirillales bacterium]